jgi:aspartyl protease family protein
MDNKILILILFVLMGLGGYALWSFGAISLDEDQTIRVISLVAILMYLLTARSSTAWKSSQTAKAAVVWTGIFLFILIGYVNWDSLRSALMPTKIIENSSGSISVSRTDDGHFYMDLEINHTNIRFLVDTGASSTVLSPSDARRIGLNPQELSYDQRVSTANGIGWSAAVMFENVRAGPYVFKNVRARVNQARMGTSLLGIDFLKLFKKFEISGDTLTLWP